MFNRIRELANILGIRDGGLVKLARDIAHDGALLDLEYMNQADAQELLTFLEGAAASHLQRKLVAA